MNPFAQKKLVEQLATPESLSPGFGAACHCSPDKELFDQELEFLWDDGDASGKSYEVYLGKISRNPIVKSKITGKYFALPWSVIIQLAVEKGIDESVAAAETPLQAWPHPDPGAAPDKKLMNASAK